MRRKHPDHAATSRVELTSAHNPLLRRSDRIQARLKSLVVALAIVMLPISVYFGMTTLAAQQDRAAEQQHSRHSVTATSTAEAVVDTPIVQSDFGAASTATVDATWTFRGAQHTGPVPFPTGSAAGTTTDIWIDDDGARAMQPITGNDAVAAALFAGVGSLVAVTLLLVGIYSAVRFHLDAQREAEWDRALARFMDDNSPH